VGAALTHCRVMSGAFLEVLHRLLELGLRDKALDVGGIYFLEGSPAKIADLQAARVRTHHAPGRMGRGCRVDWEGWYGKGLGVREPDGLV
jgi:hypothetical protein